MTGNSGHIISRYRRNDILVMTGMFLLAILTAYCLTLGFYLVPLALGGIGALVFICILAIRDPYKAFQLNLIVAFFSYYPGRLLNVDLPLYNLSDFMTVLIFLVVMRRAEPGRPQELMKSPISIVYLIYTGFFFIEALNPNMDNFIGWVFFIRRFLTFVMIYIIAYRLLDSGKRIREYVSLWLTLSVLTAAYACFQQYYGLLPFEMRYLRQNPHDYALWFQGGDIRKFSFLSDPVQVSLILGSAFLLLSALLLGNYVAKAYRRHVALACLVLVLGQSYTGTRTGNVMIMAGLALYVIMTLNERRSLIVLAASVTLFLGIMYAPIYSAPLNRFRSTFDTRDESLNVRDVNRHYIQPYIYSHPLGGGVSTSGLRGAQMNPNHALAGFPPDSGFVQAAIETGWIGYLITIIFLGTILLQGVVYYFDCREGPAKPLLLGILVCLFSFVFASYAQVAIGQIPGVYGFYPMMALLKRIRELDQGRLPA